MASTVVFSMLSSVFERMFLDFDAKHFQLSLHKGTTELRDMQLRPDFVNGLLKDILPVIADLNIRVVKATVTRVQIKVNLPFVRAKPVCVSVDDVLVIADEPPLQHDDEDDDDQPELVAEEAKGKAETKPRKRRSLVSRVVSSVVNSKFIRDIYDSLTVSVATLRLSLCLGGATPPSRPISLEMLLKGIELHQTNERWERLTARQPHSVHLFREASIASVSLYVRENSDVIVSGTKEDDFSHDSCLQCNTPVRARLAVTRDPSTYRVNAVNLFVIVESMSPLNMDDVMMHRLMEFSEAVRAMTYRIDVQSQVESQGESQSVFLHCDNIRVTLLLPIVSMSLGNPQKASGSTSAHFAIDGDHWMIEYIKSASNISISCMLQNIRVSDLVNGAVLFDRDSSESQIDGIGTQTSNAASTSVTPLFDLSEYSRTTPTTRAEISMQKTPKPYVSMVFTLHPFITSLSSDSMQSFLSILAQHTIKFLKINRGDDGKPPTRKKSVSKSRVSVHTAPFEFKCSQISFRAKLLDLHSIYLIACSLNAFRASIRGYTSEGPNSSRHIAMHLQYNNLQSIVEAAASDTEPSVGNPHLSTCPAVLLGSGESMVMQVDFMKQEDGYYWLQDGEIIQVHQEQSSCTHV